jgi:hypothetical protein
MEVALFASNRLRAYAEMHSQLPSSQASKNLRQALVNLYAHVLKFLAQAIDFEPRGTMSRVARQLWDPDNIQQFEQECERLCEVAEQEASICDRETGARWRDQLNKTLRSLDDIHKILTSLSKVHDKLDLTRLMHAKDATYDSSAEGGLPRCLAGTRVDLLDDILSWAANRDGKRIFWLCGKAGIGKSTISRTIASELDEDGRLGASFFFKRGQADRSHARLFFPTITKQLVDKIPDLGHAVAAALEKDSLLCERHMTKQFDELLLQPIQNSLTGGALPADCFVVIDALDECEDAEQIEVLLKLLGRIKDVAAVRIRILATSRPESLLVMGFKDMSNDLHLDVQVEEAQVPSIRSDLGMFFRHEITQIRSQYRRRNAFGSLPAEWVSPTDVDLLVDKSHPLFIVAFTICRLLSLSSKPREELRMVLMETKGHGLSGGLGAVYLPILRQAIHINGGREVKVQAIRFRMIIGSLILLFDPLSALALSNLLDVSIEDVGAFVSPLQSVLNVPHTAEGVPDSLGLIKLFHLSFRDFLLQHQIAEDEDTDSKLFWVDEIHGHGEIGDYCLRLLGTGALKEDICDVRMAGTRRAAVERRTIAEHLSPEVAYACTYWVQHVVKSGRELRSNDRVHQFLEKHMLHWIEALSWLGKASDVIHNFAALQSLVDVSRIPLCSDCATN